MMMMRAMIRTMKLPSALSPPSRIFYVRERPDIRGLSIARPHKKHTQIKDLAESRLPYPPYRTRP